MLAKVDEEKLKEMFDVIDEDNSGGLDKEELQAVFFQMGRDVSSKKLGKIFTCVSVLCQCVYVCCLCVDASH